MKNFLTSFTGLILAFVAQLFVLVVMICSIESLMSFIPFFYFVSAVLIFSWMLDVYEDK